MLLGEPKRYNMLLLIPLLRCMLVVMQSTFICLSAVTSQKWHVQTSQNVLCMLTVAVVQSDNNDSSISYVRQFCGWRYIFT